MVLVLRDNTIRKHWPFCNELHSSELSFIFTVKVGCAVINAIQYYAAIKKKESS